MDSHAGKGLYNNAMNAGVDNAVEPFSDRMRYGQRTLWKPFVCKGKGVHSGREVRMTVKPAAAGQGIVFRRLDIAGDAARVPARWRKAIESELCTLLQNDYGVRIQTPEHLLAALAGAGVDNALIEIDAQEVPIMDGSAAPFCARIDEAGLRLQHEQPRYWIEVLKPKRTPPREDKGWAQLSPADRFTVSCEIDYDHPHIGKQSFEFDEARHSFSAAVGRARTFGFAHKLDTLRAQGLAMGASLENTLAFSPDGVSNEGGLRYPDEPARHKVLDVIGDLALAGAPILGAFRGYRSGHALNMEVLRKLFADASAWRWAGVGMEPERAVA